MLDTHADRKTHETREKGGSGGERVIIAWRRRREIHGGVAPCLLSSGGQNACNKEKPDGSIEDDSGPQRSERKQCGLQKASEGILRRRLACKTRRTPPGSAGNATQRERREPQTVRAKKKQEQQWS
ncbi:hypothetical protein AYM40_12765 [Paraburkholderia phytofirmans OLGA172]|uniref:Uncharacterized protein n=1 Tax=Paraburkholderia phytofirmans OLGA172 TaxID=1417228 RepID=A0A160FL35_9BURK|nr:hypothetical protein AYM40_12765 [Paraburkholderia phytofirmans OLGA172]